MSDERPSPTLFVAEIPTVVQEPTFVAAFQHLDGFVGARLTFDRNNKAIGFVDFSETPFATSALQVMQGYRFVQDNNLPGINIHYSRSSGGGGGGARGGPRKRDAYDETTRRLRTSLTPGMGSFGLPATVVGGHYGMMQNDYSQSHGSNFVCGNSWGSSKQVQQHSGPQNGGLNYLPPDACCTLYVENLPGDITEREIAHIFRLFTGFNTLRLFPKQTGTKTKLLCFVEYDSEVQASYVMQMIQGYRIDRNDTTGIRIAFAKTNRKDNRAQQQQQQQQQHVQPQGQTQFGAL